MRTTSDHAPAPSSHIGGAEGVACSVVMATKNRRDELRRAIASALNQTVVPEIVVFDDGSTDGTSEMVRGEFPMVILGRHEVSQGSIVNRNRAVRAASGRIIVSIDDDAALDSRSTIEQTLKEFDHPRVGAVAMPYIDVHSSPKVRHLAPDASGVYVINAFRGCAAAWRRDLFLDLGGYPEVFIHMTEEEDLGHRVLGAGYVTRLGRADPVLHFESPNRDPKRIVQKQARNGVLMGWRNAPLAALPVHMAKSSVYTVLRGFGRGHGGLMVRGALSAWGEILRGRAGRHPLSLRTYVLYHELARHAPMTIEQIEPRLPPMRPIGTHAVVPPTPPL